MDLLEQAVLLGEAILEDHRFIEMHQAREANDQDENLQKLMQEFTLLRSDLMRESAKEEPDGEKMMSLDTEVNEVYQTIMTNPNMQKYAQVQAECDQLIQKMKRVLDFAMAGRQPEEALSEEEGCSGSCGGCSGCA